MSERQTSLWTETTEEAFGKTPEVELGRKGELLVFNEVLSWGNGWEALDHEQDQKLQVQGIDLSIKKPTWKRFYTVDVKTGKSYLNEYGNIVIDLKPDGWLLNPQKTSDRIWHVNVDTGWMAWYDRNDMKKYIQTIPEQIGDKTWYSISPKSTPDFVFRQKVKHAG